MHKTLLTVLAGLTMTGCASTKIMPEPVIDIKTDTTALETLKEISIEARHELRILAKAREAKAQESMTSEQHKQRFFQAVHVPKGFEKRKVFKYTGDALSAAKAISMLAGYKLTEVGVPVANMPFVNIDLEDEPLNEGLKELGMQTGGLIRIEVHEAANPPLMVFKYLN